MGYNARTTTIARCCKAWAACTLLPRRQLFSHLALVVEFAAVLGPIKVEGLEEVTVAQRAEEFFAGPAHPRLLGRVIDAMPAHLRGPPLLQRLCAQRRFAAAGLSHHDR